MNTKLTNKFARKKDICERHPYVVMLLACVVSFFTPIVYLSIQDHLDKPYNLAPQGVAEDIGNIVNNSVQKGYITRPIAVEVRQAKEGKKAEISHALSIYQKNCSIVISLNQNSEFDWGQKESYAELKMAPQERQFNTEWVVLHEASHCQFEGITEPILVPNNALLQRDINYYYKYSNKIEKENIKPVNAGLHTLLNENFADSYAFTQMIKKYGASQELLQFLYKHQALRFRGALNYWHAAGVIESHNSGYTIDYLTQLDTLQKIKATNNPVELQRLALEAANYGVGKILSRNYEKIMDSDSLREALNQNIYMASTNPDIYEILASTPSPSFLEALTLEIVSKANTKKIEPTDRYMWGRKRLKNQLSTPEFIKAYQDYWSYITTQYRRATLASAADRVVSPDLTVLQSSKQGEDFTRNFNQKMKLLPTLHAALEVNYETEQTNPQSPKPPPLLLTKSTLRELNQSLQRSK